MKKMRKKKRERKREGFKLMAVNIQKSNLNELKQKQKQKQRNRKNICVKEEKSILSFDKQTEIENKKKKVSFTFIVFIVICYLCCDFFLHFTSLN